MYHGYSFYLMVAAIIFIQGCGNSQDVAGVSAGKVDVSITDAPAYGFDHVWITVRDLWLHKQESAEPEHDGWIKYPLSSPATLDLLTLSNGNISLPVWENIELPEGDYTQMRVFLVRTEDPLAVSAAEEDLSYNNQVDAESSSYPLRVPDAGRGIILTGQFTVKKNEKLKLVIDFDAGHDVVKIDHDNRTEYVLKPRLAYFNLDNAGGISGSIDAAAAANNASARFVIKAEQVSPNGLARIVRRATVLDPLHPGRFVLYPLPPGTYDLVIRGLNYRTTIIKGVPVTKDTKPDVNPTLVPLVTLTTASVPDRPLDVTIESPTGAWVDFFQKLPGDAAAYEIRFRHFNPLTGRIMGFPLSSDPLQVGTYSGDAVITFQTITPEGGSGGYRAVAGAPLHTTDLSADIVTSTTNTLSFGALSVSAPLVDRSVSGSIIVPQTFAPGFLDRGVLFASRGGMIVNAVRVDSRMISGGTYSISNLPGGTPDRPLPGAFYGIDIFGWSSTEPGNRAVAAPRLVNLSTSEAMDVDITMAAP